VSVQSLKLYLAETYKLDPTKHHFKQALAKGLEAETIIRPKNMEEKGE
jgi:hypothetical protein